MLRISFAPTGRFSVDIDRMIAYRGDVPIPGPPFVQLNDPSTVIRLRGLSAQNWCTLADKCLEAAAIAEEVQDGE